MSEEMKIIKFYDKLINDNNLDNDQKKELREYLDKTLDFLKKFNNHANKVLSDKNNVRYLYEKLIGEKLEVSKKDV